MKKVYIYQTKMIPQYISKVHIFVESLHKNQISYVRISSARTRFLFSIQKITKENNQIKKYIICCACSWLFIFMQQKYLSSRNYLRAITLSWLVISLRDRKFLHFQGTQTKLLKCDVTVDTISFCNTDECIDKAGKTDLTCLLAAKFAQIVLPDLRKR